MDAHTAASSIADWMAQVGAAGLVLPNGWFGRPYDELHRLTWLEPRANRVLLELDDRLLLILTNVSHVEVGKDRLTIGAAQVVLDWQEYGSQLSHVETFASADVALVRVR
jgi:hypothetical protein